MNDADDVFVFPMTPPQRRLWALDRLSPGDPAYNVPLAFRLRGDVDAAALATALAALVERHEVLRTTFGELDGELVQLVHGAAPLVLEPIDAPGLDGAALADRLVADSRRPFDLVDGPVVRARLYRLGARDQLLFLELHHIVCDRWSLGIVAREVMAGYAGRAALPPPAYQYADYGEWLRGRLTPERLGEDLAYWRDALAGLPPAWQLPRTPGAAQPGVVERFVPRALADRVAAFARGLGATPFMPLLAGFAALLQRYQAGDDLAIGTPVANREHGAFTGTLGLFVNTLVLRVDAAGEPSLRQLTGRVRERCLAGYAHQELPFDVVASELRPGRGDDGRAPLFQAMFAMQNTPIEGLALAGLEVTPVPLSTLALKNELTLIVEDAGPAGLRATLEIDHQLFHPAQAAAFLDHYVRLLDGAIAAPDAPLARLPLLDAGERLRLTRGSAPPVELAAPRSLVDWFDATAAEHPERPAVLTSDGACSLDYRGLAAAAR
ncbi:MAG TPA: condensation domain-containing protein, partial [Kofleriaceae bacterium]